MQVKNINLNLIDGDPRRRIKCTIWNWIGEAYKIPRADFQNFNSGNDFNKNGIYFLFDKEGSVVYIGQKVNINSDFWQEAVIFTTNNNALGLTEISFLENKFYNLAKFAGRYKIKNLTAPLPVHITEEKANELNEFADYVQIIMLILGYKIFEPVEQFIDATTVENIDEPIFYLSRRSKSGAKIEAKCQKIGDKFIVLAGSQIYPKISKQAPDKVKKARKRAKIENNILMKDVSLDTPSSAAVFVTGSQSEHGPKVWKTADGVTLKDFYGENNV